MVEMGPGKLVTEVPIGRDLTKFELVMRPKITTRFNANIHSIKLERIG